MTVGEHPLSTLTIYSNQKDRTIVIEGQLQSATHASVYDLLGRTVLQQALDNTISKNILNANTLSTGMYIVKLQDDKQQLTKRIIIK